MSKTTSELTTEILVAALTSKQLSITASTTTSGANDIASAFKIIFAAVEKETSKY